VIHDAEGRRRFLDAAGALLDPWRAAAYQGAAGRQPARSPRPACCRFGALTCCRWSTPRCAPAAATTACTTPTTWSTWPMPGRAEVSPLYPMLEGQVAMLSSGLLSLPSAVALLDALFASPLYWPTGAASCCTRTGAAGFPAAQPAGCRPGPAGGAAPAGRRP
jgi:hypothetical protein